MTEYVHDTHGIKTEREIVDSIKSHTSIGPNTLTELGWEAVLQAPKPTPSGFFKSVRRDGVTTDANGNKVQAWLEYDTYSGPTQAADEADATLAYADKRKEEVKAVAKTKMSAGTTVAGIQVDTDLEGRTLALGAKIGSKANRRWVKKDGTTVTLTATQVNALLDGIDDYIQSVFDRRADLVDSIEAVKTDIIALQAIDIDTGWPP